MDVYERSRRDPSTDAHVFFERRSPESTFGVSFTETEWKIFSSLFRVERFDARDTVKSPSRPGNLIFYVAEGLVRFYYLNDDATESDRLFAPAGVFVRPVTAFAQGILYGCQALEPSVVLTAPYETLCSRLDSSLAFQKFDAQLSRTMLSRKDHHVKALQVLSAAERVRDFAQTFPDLVDRVPQYHIANYLGMSPISYSRLKKNTR